MAREKLRLFSIQPDSYTGRDRTVRQGHGQVPSGQLGSESTLRKYPRWSVFERHGNLFDYGQFLGLWCAEYRVYAECWREPRHTDTCCKNQLGRSRKWNPHGQYGYLKRGIKDLIDEIVDLLAEDENIAKLYDLWYEKKYEALRTYTSEMPQKIPLSQNKEFKSIKNDIIREAIRMNQSGEQKHESRTDSNTTSHHGSEKKTAPHHQTNSVRVTAVTGLLKNLANTFRDKILGDDAKKLPTIDKRQRREIEEKKNAEITMQ